MFTVYAIYNKDKNKIYVGQTSELTERLKRHNKISPNKKTSFTAKNTGLWVLIYKEKYHTRLEAIKREKELKSAKGRQFIKNLIIHLRS